MVNIQLLLMFGCYLQFATAGDYTVTNYAKNAGLYYENIGEANIYIRDFNIITYYDLDKYYNNYENVKTYANKVSELCKGAINSMEYNYFIKLYESILANLEHKHELIGDTIGINRVSVRQKRKISDPVAIAVVEGIFGVIGTAIKENTVANEVENYRHEVDQLQKMVENQMFLYENFQREVNDKFIEVSNNIDKLLNEVNHLDANINILFQTTKIHSLIHITNSLLELVSMEQSDLLDCLILARQGVIHPMIMSVKMLKEKLLEAKDIARYDPHIANLLGVAAENANEMFNMMKPIIYRRNKKVIFDFDIPLISEAYYDIYKLTSAPVLINGDVYSYIYPEQPYLFVEKKNERHFFLDKYEFDECKIAGEKLYVCKRVKPLRAKNLTCEHKLISNPKLIPSDCDVRLINIYQTIFVELEQDGSWIFVAPESENLHMYCNQQLLRTSIKGTGVLTINATCQDAETDSLFLRDYTTNNLNLPLSFRTFMPKANLNEFVQGTNINYLRSPMNLAALSRSETVKLKEIGIPPSFLRMIKREYTADKLQGGRELLQKAATGSAKSFSQIPYIIYLLSSFLIYINNV